MEWGEGGDELMKEERIESRKIEEKVEEKLVKEDKPMKGEVKEEADVGGFGVVELHALPNATAKAELQAREAEERAEKTMSARERFLARKKAEVAAAGAG